MADGDRVVTGVEDEERDPTVLFQELDQAFDLGDRRLGGIGGRRNAHDVERSGPAVGIEVHLGDPLVAPARHDRLAGRVLRRRVVEAAFGTALSASASSKRASDHLTKVA